MKPFDFSNLFGSNNKKSSAKTQQHRRNRTLRIEELESREMLDAGLMSALDDLFFSSSPPYENDTVVVEIAGNTVSRSSSSSLSSSSSPAQSTAPAAAPAGYNENDWNVIATLGLQNETNQYIVRWSDTLEKRLVSLRIENRNLVGTLDVSNCTSLVTLNCYSNNIQSLNVTGCTALERLDADDTRLESIDVSSNVSLKELMIRNTYITSLDISGNTSIEQIYHDDLDTLNAAGCTKLREVDNGSIVKNIDVSGTALYRLSLRGTETFNITNCLDLQVLTFDDTKLTSLTLSASDIPSLCELSIAQNANLFTVNVSGLPNLETLQCANNARLTTVNAAGNAKLKYANFAGGYYAGGVGGGSSPALTTINLSGCSSLTFMSASNNNGSLSSLLLDGCSSLQQLRVSGNKLRALDLSDCAPLQELDCYDNRLTSLDLTGCPYIENLRCYDNELASLEISNCAYLETLQCYNNRLTTLDVSNSVYLKWFDCFNNLLSSLDLSGLTRLENMQCFGNNLVSLTLDFPIQQQYLQTSAAENVPLTLRWNSIELADSYIVKRKGHLGWGEFTDEEIVYQGTAAQFILQPQYDAAYTYSLEAVVGGTNHSVGKDLSVSYGVGVPTNLREITASSSEVLLAWDAYHECQLFSGYYTLQRKGPGDSEWQTVAGYISVPQYLDTGLTAGTEYTYRLMVVPNTSSPGYMQGIVYGHGSSNYMEQGYGTDLVVTTLTVSQLAAPMSVARTGRTMDSITLSWSSVNNALGYEIQWKKTGDTDWTPMTGISETTKIISGLETDTEYQFQVRAVNDDVVSNWSAAVSISTSSTVEPPSTEPGDTLASAMVVEFVDGTFTTTQKIGDGDYESRDVDLYQFTVSAADVGKTFTFSTFLPAGGSSVDTYIRLFNSAGTQLAYNDDGGNDYAYSYLSYTPIAGGTYYLGVSSYYSAGYNPNTTGSGSGSYESNAVGDYTLTITMTGTTVNPTDPPATPTGLISTSKTANTVVLEWNTVSNATDYEIEFEYRKSNVTHWTTITASECFFNVSADGSKTVLMVDDLVAGTTYRFQVRAVNNDGESAWSASVAVTTEGIPAEKEPEKSVTKVANMTATDAQKKDTLNKITVGKKNTADAPTYNTVTFVLPSPKGMTKANKSNIDYDGIQIEVWGPKNSITKGEVPFWGTIMLAIGADGSYTVVSQPSAVSAKVANGKLVLSGLSAGTKYSLQMQAVTFDESNAVGVKSKALKVSASTLKYTAVQKLKAPKADITSSSVTLEWQASKALPAGASARYEIVCMVGGMVEKTQFVESTAVATITQKVDGLKQPGKKYTFVVRAITELPDGDIITSQTAKVSAKTL